MLCFPGWNPGGEIPEAPRQYAVMQYSEQSIVQSNVAPSQEPGRNVLKPREKMTKYFLAHEQT